jgi:hypothetical protein
MKLHKGMKLFYNGFETTPSVEIKNVLLPGHDEYDGALPGIVFRWIKKPRKPSFFYPCKSTKEFLSDDRFKNLVEAA